MSQVTGGMGDKEILNDAVASQKLITGSYNTFANECVNVNLRSEFLNILNDEHTIHDELFSEMQKHGWYQVDSAEQQKINQAMQKFSQI